MRLYACIISTDAKDNKAPLLSIAEQFSYSIELLEDGILFDVSGLQNLVGDAKKISQKILSEMKKNSISGSIAVANTIETAELLARGSDDVSSNPKSEIRNPQSEDFSHLPIQNLLIDDDTLNVFSDLDLIDRYHLRVHPVLLKEGKPLFQESGYRPELKLIGEWSMDSGTTLLQYERGMRIKI